MDLGEAETALCDNQLRAIAVPAAARNIALSDVVLAPGYVVDRGMVAVVHEALLAKAHRDEIPAAPG